MTLIGVARAANWAITIAFLCFYMMGGAFLPFNVIDNNLIAATVSAGLLFSVLAIFALVETGLEK